MKMPWFIYVEPAKQIFQHIYRLSYCDFPVKCWQMYIFKKYNLCTSKISPLITPLLQLDAVKVWKFDILLLDKFALVFLLCVSLKVVLCFRSADMQFSWLQLITNNVNSVFLFT